MTRRQRSACVAAWALSRLVLALLAAGVLPYGEAHRVSATSDIRVYERFAAVLAQGHFPIADPTWQYPPGGAPLLLLPRLLPGPYAPAFAALMLACDLIVLLLLQRLAARHGAAAGPWVWVVGVAVLGPIVLGRFDVVPAALAVAALASPRAVLAGALAGTGALVKVWPVTALTGLPPGQLRRAGGAAVAVAGGGALVLGALLPGAGSFLRFQGARGLQVEAVAATPYLLARHVGASVPTGPRYGAREVLAGGAGAVALACSLLTAAALAGAVLWRARVGWDEASGATAYDAALALTLLLVVTSRVLSPQYLVWLLAVAAACATRPDSSQRGVTGLVLAAAALTQLEFPLLFAGVVRGALGPDLVLAARNAVLVAATVLSCRRLWAASGRGAALRTPAAAAQDLP